MPKTFATFIALVANLLVNLPARAITVSRDQWDQAGAACQLSTPSTSSKVRQQAAGMRNEGTTNEFVICQFTSTSALEWATINFQSLDGMDHIMKCTGMAGTTLGFVAYSSKSASVPPDTFPGEIVWMPVDFGGSKDFGSSLFSVTCLLPAGVQLVTLGSHYEEDVGG